MDDEDHLTAVAWNAFAIVATEELIVDEKLPQTLADMGPKLVFKTMSENVGSMWSWIDKILNGDPGEKVTD